MMTRRHRSSRVEPFHLSLALIGAAAFVAAARGGRARDPARRRAGNCARLHQPAGRREVALPAPARPQPGRLVPVGAGGVREGEEGEQADLPVRRLLHLPLVPRHGAGVVRGPGHRQAPQRRFVADQGGPRGAAGRGPVYMAFVQATTGSGGWPMTVFLTPDLKPFFGGTYFPPEDARRDRPASRRCLPRVRAGVGEGPRQGRRVGREGDGRPEAVRGRRRRRATTSVPPPLDAAFARYAATFDKDHGGFGARPEVPRAGRR